MVSRLFFLPGIEAILFREMGAFVWEVQVFIVWLVRLKAAVSEMNFSYSKCICKIVVYELGPQFWRDSSGKKNPPPPAGEI